MSKFLATRQRCSTLPLQNRIYSNLFVYTIININIIATKNKLFALLKQYNNNKK
jgi:hypothetical protein